MVHVPPAAAAAAATGNDSDSRLAFVAAAPRPRRDGWTAARQTAFIAALAGGDSVTAACRAVGCSPKSAYALRRRADGAGFASAWDTAVAEVESFAVGRAIDRCLDARREPVLYRGRVVGERVVHNDRLLMHMLCRTAPGRRPGGAVSLSAIESITKRLIGAIS